MFTDKELATLLANAHRTDRTGAASRSALLQYLMGLTGEFERGDPSKTEEVPFVTAVVAALRRNPMFYEINPALRAVVDDCEGAMTEFWTRHRLIQIERKAI